MIIVNGRFLTQKISGVQRFSIEIIKRLKYITPELEIVAPPAVLDKELASELGVKFVGHSSGHFWEQFELFLYLKRLGSPLLLNLTNTGPVLYNNHIATVHDLAFKKSPEWFNWKIALAYNAIIPHFARKAKHVLTVSDFSRKEIHRNLKIQLSKITVAPNAVTLYKSAAKNVSHFGFSKRNYLLAVGSLDPRKNLINLVKAFKIASIPGLELILIGDKKKVFNTSYELKHLLIERNVSFTGYLPDQHLIEAYQNAKAFIFPSLYEGFGIPPLEAMAYNCPVCVSEIPPLRETCVDAALYFDPNNIESMVNAIHAIVNNEDTRIKLQEIGLKQASVFSWKRSSEIVKKLIEQGQYNNEAKM